jgi:hypothetical protein
MVATEFAKNARYAPPDARTYSGPHVQTAAQVADVAAEVIANPVPEVYTNPASADMALRYLEDVAAFEQSGGNPWQTRPPTGGGR